MTDQARKEILRKVAAGEMSPQEAAYALEETDRAAPPAPLAERDSGLRRLVVRATMGSVTVVGDAGVGEAVATGAHRARREGDALVIESEPMIDDEGSAFRFGPFGINRERVVVRANPDLELEVLAEAGSLTVEGMSGPIRGEVQAGSVRISRFRAPLNLDVQAGSVTATGRLDGGESHIRCQAGSVRLSLEAGSSVRIVARSSLGKITLPNGIRGGSLSGKPFETTVGSGAGRLDVDAELGAIAVDAQ